MSSNLRHFYVDTPLASGQTVTLPEELQHRLAKVLRLKSGDTVGLFNGKQGLFSAQLMDGKARSATVGQQQAPQPARTPLMLALAMPKRDAWESALRQATELGATDILPLTTEFAQVARINEKRAHILLVEAAEQCESLSLPALHQPQSLPGFLANLKQSCAWAYERKGGEVGLKAKSPQALLVGPEGGFSAEEVSTLQKHPQIHPFSLGATILRVDTAVVAGLTLLKTF